MSFGYTSSPGAKGLGISVRQIHERKSLPRLPPQDSFASTKHSRANTEFSHTSPSRSCIQTFYRYECDTWAFEVFNIVLSLAALATVLVALWYYDGKAAPEWPYSLTLNAFISVCMMVMGAALTVPVSNGIGQIKWLMARKGNVSIVDLDTLDRASRGMWGSVCAIFTWSGGILGSIGAVITIVAFAAAPFAQQAISAQDGSIELSNDEASTIAACGSASDLRTICTGTSILGASARGLNIVPTLLRGGYYSAVYSTFNNSVPTNRLATCPGGNCTWSPFTTLSLCKQCVDVTQFLEYSNRTDTLTGQLVSLPDGPSLHTAFDTFAIDVTLNSSRVEANTATAYSFAVLETSNQTTSGNKAVNALECKIDFCVQQIQAELLNGVYNETVLQQTSKHRRYERKAPGRTSSDIYLEFETIQGLNADDDRPISLDKSQPACLGGLLNFDEREVLALTELGLDGIEPMVNDISLSASRSIRTLCDGGVRYPGSSWKTVTLVRVTWWWLLLPVIVEVVGVAFFCCVAIMNTQSKTTIWKSSLIAALYHSLDSAELDSRHNLEGLYDMEQTAETMKVTLCSESSSQRSRLVNSSEESLTSAQETMDR